MKRNLLFLLVLVLTSVTSAFAQNEVYWREDFTVAATQTSDPAAASVVYTYTGLGGVWTMYGIWTTTGTDCPAGAGVNRHIRSTGNTSLGTATAGTDFDDTAFAITPDVSKGIMELHLIRSRVNRRMSIYKSSAASVNSTDYTGWTLVSVIPKSNGSPAVACADTMILINDVNAKRIMLKFERGGNQDTDSIYLTSVLTLPVKFTGINATLTGGNVKVNWETATEANLAGYVVERSYNGKDFSAVANTPVKENGTTGFKSYSWTDNNPLSGTNFYRIKAVEKDGQVSYTTIVKVNTSSTRLEVTVAPNPVRNGEMNIQLSSVTKGTYSVRVINNVGQVIFTGKVTTEGGSLNQTFRLPGNIKMGIYTLQVAGNDINLNKKIAIE
jgi:hypothetical protein